MTDPEGKSTYWLRCWFKQGKVYAECLPDGSLLEREGRVLITYKKGDKRSYSTHPSRLRPVEGAVPDEGAAVDAPAPNRTAKAGSRKGTTQGSSGRGAGAKANASVLGGSWEEVEDPICIHLWSDGACSGNPGPAGAGTVLLFGGRRKEIATFLGDDTNNGAELFAVLQGLQALRQPVAKTVVVHTDSQYVIGVLARGWKAKANQERVHALRDCLRDIPRVVWHWVRGHEGVELNERCDFLATEAVRTQSSWVDECA